MPTTSTATPRAQNDAPHRRGGLKTTSRAVTTVLATDLGNTVMLSAFGSTAASAQMTSRSARSPKVAHSAPAATKSVSSSLLPLPTGGLAVGVRTLPSVSPAAITRVWYPARRGTGTGKPIYLADKTAAALGLPAEALHGVRPRASVNAKPARSTKPRPAVVLMPGWGNPMALSTALAQDLASNGYVVVAVDPTPGTEDGSRLPADTANPPGAWNRSQRL